MYYAIKNYLVPTVPNCRRWVTEYRKDRDIYRVSKMLGHASIPVTERYLKGLGKMD